MTKFYNISTDNTLGGNSPGDDIVVSQKAIKDYVDGYAMANTSLSNLTPAGKTVCAHMAMPSGTYDNLTLGTTGATYTAPADGYFALASTFDANGYLYMYRSGTPRYGTTLGYVASQWVDSFIPVAKGDVIIIQYNGTASVQSFKFIYANGAS